MKDSKYINVRFSYNGSLGVLQQKTIDNKLFVNTLLQNDIITYDEYAYLIQRIHEYFIEQIQKVVNNPFFYIDTI